MVTVYVWTGIPISAQFGITGPYHAGILIAGIMNNGIFGLIMSRRFSILN
ncbi:hypothetical protein [Methanosarcina horonobensis]|nr:hypothetical protein [Methanosarcina horonobensis]